MNLDAPAISMTIEEMVNRDVSNLNNTLQHLVSEKFPNIYLVRDQMYFYIYKHVNEGVSEKLGYFKAKDCYISHLNLDQMELFGEISNLINFLKLHPYAIFALELSGFIRQS